jgi:hypothetical protein
MFAGGAVLLACLVAPGLYNLSMIGSGNTNPPSIAFLAFALAQCGLVLAVEPAGSRFLQRPAVWRGVRRLNATVMIVYLWHFVPAIIVAVAFYPTGLLPQPAVGSAEWWALRLVWFALLTVVLIPLVVLLMWAQRPLLRIPAGIGRPGPWSPAILLAGLAATMFGLARLAIGGPAPGGHLAVLALAAFAAGLLATFCTGRPSGTSPKGHVRRWAGTGVMRLTSRTSVRRWSGPGSAHPFRPVAVVTGKADAAARASR